jgi:drug/metabolite transporter superfamily protein YnfA
MNRERALKVVLFLAGVYPLIAMLRQEPALAMMMSLYITLGVFLLLASRNPPANRSLIAFAAWSSFAHATVMGAQASLNMIQRKELVGVAVFVVIGMALILLAPPKQSVEQQVPAAKNVLSV